MAATTSSMEKDVIYARQRHAWMKAGDPAQGPPMTKNVIYAQGRPHRDSVGHFA